MGAGSVWHALLQSKGDGIIKRGKIYCQHKAQCSVAYIPAYVVKAVKNPGFFIPSIPPACLVIKENMRSKKKEQVVAFLREKQFMTSCVHQAMTLLLHYCSSLLCFQLENM